MTPVHTAPLNIVTPRTTSTSTNSWTINLADLDDKSQRWHPKITPYRLATIVITIVLGSLKALYAHNGQTGLSTTLEWIIGVVVFLMCVISYILLEPVFLTSQMIRIYILGLYEELQDDEDDTTSLRSPLKWFFCYDCLDIIWGFLRLFSVKKPSYQSKNRKIVVRHYDWYPPVTGYRLLVSFVILGFGVAKMICGYLGLDVTANALDWSFGVVITSM